MMNDLISRQAAIDKIYERQRKLIYCFGFENDAVKIMDIAKSLIIAMPSAQPEPKWIPCSERLPEKFQTCIVTDELRQCTYEYDYDPKNEFTKKYGWRYNGRQIIAWMPLPEPYAERRINELQNE